MAYLLALAVSLQLLVLGCADKQAGAGGVKTNERSSMTDAQTKYRAIEHDPKVTSETTVAADGSLQLRVHLTLSRGNFAWAARLDEATLASYLGDVAEVKKLGLVSAEAKTSFVVITSTGDNDARIASWQIADETPAQTAVRNALDNDVHLHYGIALAYLKAGHDAELAGDRTLAGNAYKEGVEVLGNEYRDKSVLDDTGMKLVLADGVESDEGIEAAGPVYRGILQNRLALYANPRKLPGL
jgi:hypothetical protein